MSLSLFFFLFFFSFFFFLSFPARTGEMRRNAGERARRLDTSDMCVSCSLVSTGKSNGSFLGWKSTRSRARQFFMSPAGVRGAICIDRCLPDDDADEGKGLKRVGAAEKEIDFDLQRNPIEIHCLHLV